ncbi:MAG: PQQ-binding-like beta-propeller repeat protein [Pirellulales bacterium]|nr:PQQ-binding-like beta-propeller repeat protein [Pirellulales bacterium]
MMQPSSHYYPTVFLTALVAGLFSIAVCVLLWVNYIQRSGNLAEDVPQYLMLKESLRQQPDNAPLREKIRGLDLQLRQEYFRERRFTYHGVFLLLGGLATTLITARWAATLRRKLPMPDSISSRQDPDMQVARFAYPALAVLGILFTGSAILLVLSHQSLPSRLGEMARWNPPDTGLTGTLPTPNPAPAPDLATPEEIAVNWPRFRGPRGDGISAYSNIPTTWHASSGQGILWKAPVPLPGNSSPVIWGNHIFLTGATEERREVYCFDASTGTLLWQKEVPAGSPDSPPPKVTEDTGYAAPTAATDGRHVCVMFANGDVAAFDFAGNLQWHLGLGTPKNIYGHATSLAIYRDLLFVQFDQGSAKDGLSQLLALETSTGEIVWKKPRPVPNSWSSPLVVDNATPPQIIACGDPWVISYAATDGAELWRAKCLRADIGPSPVVADGIAYAVSEFPCLSAIRIDGTGDVTETHIAWTADSGLPDTCGPLVTPDYVLLLASYGTLTCYDKNEGGDPLWEMDFDGNFRSSPSLVENRVYLLSEEGTAWVVELGREMGQQIAEADLGEPCVTSPAFQDGRIYVRGAEHLFCIGLESEIKNQNVEGMAESE